MLARVGGLEGDVVVPIPLVQDLRGHSGVGRGRTQDLNGKPLSSYL